MSEAAVAGDQAGDVRVSGVGTLRRLTLNRPKALNALTRGMAETMTRCLQSWAADPGVGAVLIDGAGDRGLCAGGDLRALYDAAKAKTPLPAQFWSTEYRLNVLIARYAKPVIAVMDGVVMGGGVGLAAHAAHRVVTDRSSVAMPEVGIGFFPDVGVSFLLARAPGAVGTHLALSGSRINAADALYCGLADIHVPAAELAALPAALADCRSATEVSARLGELAVPPATGGLAAARDWIDRCYGCDRVEDIIDRLARCEAPAAAAACETLRKASPTSLKVTLRNLRDAALFERVEQCFAQDYRIALACIAGHDFIEGIRATIVDKDRKPAWRPDRIETVTADIVERHFRSAGELELKF
jgi:enoyl-CoA hydratase